MKKESNEIQLRKTKMCFLTIEKLKIIHPPIECRMKKIFLRKEIVQAYSTV